MTRKRRKCRLTKQGFLSCDTFRRAENVTGSRQVLETQAKYIRTNGEQVGEIAVLYAGEFRRDGVLLDFCPFCGVRIYRKQKVKRKERTQ
jgi:hypothetical protein